LKNENFRVKILGWPKKGYGTFSGSKLLADSKNVHGWYVWGFDRYRLELTSKSSKNAYFWNQGTICN
jgi:hypothetical protein